MSAFRRLLTTVSFFVSVLGSTAALAGSDPTQTYLATVNNPLPSYPNAPTLPVIAGAMPDDGLRLSSGAKPYFTMILGTAQAGANVTTGQQVRNLFFLNYFTGNLNEAIGSPMDTGQANNSVFAAVARHYAVGDPSDLHVMLSDGLHLRAVCAGVPKSCTPGNVYAAMIRLQAEFRPGMTIEVRYQSPPGQLSWAPIWLFSGMQISPGPGNNAYQDGTDVAGALVQLGNAYEIDMNDNYVRSGQVPVGQQLDFGVPSENWETYSCNPPYFTYAAQGNGYAYVTPVAPPFESLPINWSTGFHDLVMSWATDGYIQVFVDGVRVNGYYNEFPQSTYVDAYDHDTVKQVPEHLIIGNQAIPAFAPNNIDPQENEGLGPDGWAIVVQKIAAWYGTVATPYVNAAPNALPGRQACQK